MGNNIDFPATQLENVVDILDYLRIPVNEVERLSRLGQVPYYGANGQQGWIDRPLFDEPLILMAEDGGNFDEFSTRPIAYRIDGPAWVNNHAHILRAKEGTCQSFIFWSLVNKDIRRFIAGGTRTKLTQRELRQIEICLPSRYEQNKIATILDTLDNSIRKTEAIIEKLKQIKQGLLHDLLTRGIDANGELRPPHEQAPHLYKESPLGWIPKEWDTFSISQLLADTEPAMRSGPFGSALLKSELVETGIALLGIDNILVERFDRNFARFVSLKKFRELSRYSVRPHDLMITIMGTVGRCCLIPDDISDALSSKHTWAITLDKSKYLPYLAMLQINYAPWILRHFARDEQGGVMSAIRSETLRSAPLPTPPIDEQYMIEKRIQNLARRLDLEITHAAKLRKKKSALMDDLLTGRVHVTPLLAENPPAP